MERLMELLQELGDCRLVLQTLETEMPRAALRKAEWLQTVFALSVELEVEASRCQRSILAACRTEQDTIPGKRPPSPQADPGAH